MKNCTGTGKTTGNRKRDRGSKKQLGELKKKEEEYKGLLRETELQEVYLTKDEKAEKKTEPKEEKKRTGEIFDETGEKQEGANEKVRYTHSLETEKKTG